MPKVLISVPYHETKRYCFEELLNSVKELNNPDYEILMRWDTQKYGGDNNVKKQREAFRKYALDNDFEWLYFHGADTIPPIGVIEKLLAHNQPIVGAVYFGRNNAQNGEINVPVAWIHSLKPVEMGLKTLKNEGLITVDGMGMDAVLIHRSVFSKISWMSWLQNDDDYPFYDKAKELGFIVYLDTNLHCRHYYENKKYVYKAQIYDEQYK